MRRLGSFSVGALAILVLLAGCATHAGPGATDVETVASTNLPTAPGPDLGRCGGLTRADADAAVVGASLTQVWTSPVSCDWESLLRHTSNGAWVGFEWFRGSPIDRQRTAAVANGANVVEQQLGGRPAFSMTTGKPREACQVAVDFGGDYALWSVRDGDAVVREDLCVRAGALAERSLSRAGGPVPEVLTHRTQLAPAACPPVGPEHLATAIGSGPITLTADGAVCRYGLAAGPANDGATPVELAAYWFETGTLERERGWAGEHGFHTAELALPGVQAVQIVDPQSTGSCGIAYATGETGVLGWWADYPAGGAPTDPCAQVTRLAQMTMTASN